MVKGSATDPLEIDDDDDITVPKEATRLSRFGIARNLKRLSEAIGLTSPFDRAKGTADDPIPCDDDEQTCQEEETSSPASCKRATSEKSSGGPAKSARPVSLPMEYVSTSETTATKATDADPSPAIPIRSSPRCAPSSITPAQSPIPLSPRQRLEYVMRPGAYSASQQSGPNLRTVGSKERTSNESQPDKLNPPSSASTTAPDRPFKALTAKKTASNLGPRRPIRAPPSKLCTTSSNLPRPSTSLDATSLDAHDAQATSHRGADLISEKSPEPERIAKVLPENSAANESTIPRLSADSTQDDQATKNMPLAIDTFDLDIATATIDARVEDHLRDVHENHALRVQRCMRKQRLCFEREGLLKDRPTQGRVHMPNNAEKFVQPISPFKKMQPIDTAVQDKNTKSLHFYQEIFSGGRNKKTTSRVTGSTTRYRSTATKVPPYRSYVSLRDSILAENERSMLIWPYFTDEETGGRDLSDMTDELEAHYKMKNITHKWHALLSDVYEFYNPSAEALLTDVGLTWEDIVYWYLAPAHDITSLNNTQARAQFQIPLLQREINWDSRFDRSTLKWKRIFQKLSQPTPHTLRLAALVSLSFSKQTNFDLWHLARRGEFLQKEISRRLEGNKDGPSKFEYRRAMCRVCQRHNCPVHGELREWPEEDHEPAPESQTTSSEVAGDTKDDDDSDSDVEDVGNYRCAANAHTLTPYLPDDKDLYKIPAPPSEFKGQWWLNRTSAATWEYRQPFYPCNHEGTCDQARCRCFVENITCEKSCKCSASCKRRFPGCSCSRKEGNQRVCGTKACLCYMMNRECDADLCGGCGATEILDPVNRYNDWVGKDKCCNVAIQRGVQKKTLLGHSEVHGFGLYVGEDVKKDDFLGEYKGETITQNESARRAIIYHEQKTMYLFKLNKEQDVDSTHFGNKMRFVNNSSHEGANCHPKNLLCNTVHRIGLYATKDLRAGTELFFHYGYAEEQTKGFKEPGKPTRVVAVKSSKANKAATKPKDVQSRQTRLSTPERRKQTEKARAALHAKIKNTQATVPDSAADSAGGPKRARKSVQSSDIIRPKRGIHRGKVDISSGNMPSTKSSAPIDRASDQEDYVPDETDEADEDTVMQDVDIPVSSDGITNETYHLRPSRTRQGMVPLLTARQRSQTSSHGGPRPGAGRPKRKVVVSSSDDE